VQGLQVFGRLTHKQRSVSRVEGEGFRGLISWFRRASHHVCDICVCVCERDIWREREIGREGESVCVCLCV